MKIPLPLPQFKKEKVLIISAGDRVAEFYAVITGQYKKSEVLVYLKQLIRIRKVFLLQLEKEKYIKVGRP